MLCEKCKLNKAVGFETIVEEDELKKVNLCTNCLNEQKKKAGNINITDFFDAKKSKKEEIIYCGFCNTSSKDFFETSYLGCEQCYDTFSDILDSVLINLHNSKRHTGKYVELSSIDKNVNKELVKLARKLDELVEQDNYLEAGKVKKQINELKEKLL